MIDIFDEVAFRRDVMELLHGSPVAGLLNSGIKFDFNSWKGDIAAIQQLAPAIIASIQIVKQNVQTAHPNEPWNRIAIETAAQILNDSLVLTGFWSKLKSFLLGPVIRAILEGALATFKALARGGDWLGLAKALLGLVV